MKENWWAIGTTPGGTEVQDFVKFEGKENRIWNDQLEGVLEENRWYYVTLTTVNGALLNTTQTTSGELNNTSCVLVFSTHFFRDRNN